MLRVVLFILACTNVISAIYETCSPDMDIFADNSIKDDQFTASSEIKSFEGFRISFNRKGKWCSHERKPAIKIKLKDEYVIKNVTIFTQQKSMYGKFKIEFKFHGIHVVNPFKWFHGKPAGSIKSNVVFLPPTGGDEIIITFLEDDNTACYKMKVFGCKVIKVPFVDHCKINNTCEQICENGRDGPICSCYSGYAFNYTSRKCEDVNECALGSDTCDVATTSCINYFGGYRCKCLHPGLKLNSRKRNCIDIDECQQNNGFCQHRCINSYGSYRCECYDNYELASNNLTCLDVNECKNSSLNTCDTNTTKCANTRGDFECKCLPGLEHIGGKKSSCKDIDECQIRNGGCEHFCTNTYGSYYCSCKNNTELDTDNRRCIDIDECGTGKHECEQECVNTYGGHLCRCTSGFNLNDDGKTCRDRNECEPNDGKGLCEFKCENTLGSYKCSCDKGYVLNNDHRTCIDFDECAVDNECDTAVSTCENTYGSYNCRCNTGYQKDLTGTCIAKKCPALMPPQNGQVYPPNCMFLNAKQFKDVCNFRCHEGYELDNDTAKQAYCTEFGHWYLRGKFQPICRRSRCQRVPAITHAVVIPSSCQSDGAKYEDTCIAFCDPGYRLEGTRQIECQKDLQYDGTFNDTKCVKKLKIVCPKDLHLILPIGSNNVTLPLAKLNLKGNIEEMETYPAGVLTQKYKFKSKAASQPVELFYKSDRKESCIFHVTVMDKESPNVENCPKSNYYVLINQPRAKVTWPEPKFTDNVQVTKVIQNFKNNQYLSPQVYYVFYTASDDYNNHVTCRFFLHIKAKYCSKDLIPGGDLAVKTWLQQGAVNSLQVFMNCPPGSTFSSNITGVGLFNCKDGLWNTNEIPDCVSYGPMSSGGCPAGKRIVLKARSRQTVCANCPKGTKGVDGYCVKCGKGSFQYQQGSTSCIPCPAGTTSTKVGAKNVLDCKALCILGTYSSTGFYESTGCNRCPEGSYQDEYGQSSCKLCPNNADTYKGATSADDCRFAAKISSISPSQKINAIVGETINIDCIAKGNPAPFVQIKNATELAPASFRGKTSFRPLLVQTKYESGLRLTITRVQIDDAAIYRCVAVNKRGDMGGEDEREIYVDVKYKT